MASTVQLQEKYITVADGVVLHALNYKILNNKSKGLIFFLHGNGGENLNYVPLMEKYVKELGYDVFIVDYRGYGLSTGSYTSKEEIFSDMEVVYQQILKDYDNKKIIVAAHSLGTGIGAKLASTSANKPRAYSY